MLAVGSGEGASRLVRLRRAHASHIHQQLHHLLLPHDDAAAAREGAFLQRVVVVPLHAVTVAVDELRDGAALHTHAGAYQRDLVCEVAQAARAQALRYLELRRGLQQEHSFCLAFVYHVVHGGIFRAYSAQIRAMASTLFYEVERLFYLIQYGQGQDVYLGGIRRPARCPCSSP